ncbi:hypothetical protein FSP39_016046 [Pinctada imbricata]|uniref:Myeloid differentiation primary response protein MyD88 n=1 Tax=Pinctada imbricata TaxID=66713 RepID=A0AA89CCS9_PINIB|nr:hypothetical protein FSP39_016046 [Pinctada imbricata]
MGEGVELPEGYGCLPLTVLGHATHRLLTMYLDPAVDIATDEGLTPDVYGLAELAGFDAVFTRYLDTRTDKTKTVLQSWAVKPGATLGKLLTSLIRLERHDCLTEIKDAIVRDVKKWMQGTTKELNTDCEPKDKNSNRNGSVQNHTSHPSTHAQNEDSFLTPDDVESGQETYYVACICCADGDLDIAHKIVQRFSPEAKFFIPQEQLLIGKYEYETTAEIIEDRCNSRLVVIMSRDYVNSPAAIFSTQFVKTIDPDARRRKIIPIIKDEDVTYPRVLRGINAIKFRRLKYSDMFWKLLSTSLSISLSTSNKSHNSSCESFDACPVQEPKKSVMNDTSIDTKGKSLLSLDQNVTDRKEINPQGSFCANIGPKIVSQISYEENDIEIHGRNFLTQMSRDDNACSERLRSCSVDSNGSIIDNAEVPSYDTVSQIKRNIQQEDKITKCDSEKISNLPSNECCHSNSEEKTVIQNTENPAKSKTTNKKFITKFLRTFNWKSKGSKKDKQQELTSPCSLPVTIDKVPSHHANGKTRSNSMSAFSHSENPPFENTSRDSANYPRVDRSLSSNTQVSWNLSSDKFNIIQNEYSSTALQHVKPDK